MQVRTDPRTEGRRTRSSGGPVVYWLQRRHRHRHQTQGSQVSRFARPAWPERNLEFRTCCASESGQASERKVTWCDCSAVFPLNFSSYSEVVTQCVTYTFHGGPGNGTTKKPTPRVERVLQDCKEMIRQRRAIYVE